jgi:uncharacterized membrane protein
MSNLNNDLTMSNPRKQFASRMGIGIALGAAIGAAMGNIALVLAIGMIVGGIGIAIQQ